MFPPPPTLTQSPLSHLLPPALSLSGLSLLFRYCDNHRCEFRNFKLIYVCERCGTKHDPKLDAPPSEKPGNEINFFRRRARKAQKEKTDELSNAIVKIISIDMDVAGRNVQGIVDAMKSAPNNSTVQVKGSDGFASLTLDGKSGEVMQLEGVRLVVEAMDRFVESVHVQRSAFKLLLNICLVGERGLDGMRSLYRAGVIPAVVAAMRDFEFDSILQWCGSQIFFNLAAAAEDFGRYIWLSGGLLALQKVWDLRKAWSVKRAFRRQLSAAIHHLQTFGPGGSRHDSSDRNRTATSRGSQQSSNYSTVADDLETSRAATAATEKALRDELNKKMGADDVAELSEDEDEILMDQKIRSNITSLLLKKGWRVGRHPYVPECMDALFSEQKEFDLHKYDEACKLYVPSRSSSRAGSRAGSSRAGSRAGNRGEDSGGAEVIARSRAGSSRAGEGSQSGSRAGESRTTTPGVPFFDPINVDVKEGDRPKTSDRPGVWSDKVGQYTMGGGFDSVDRESLTLQSTSKEGQSEEKDSPPRRSVFAKSANDLHVSPMASPAGSRQGSRQGSRRESGGEGGGEGGGGGGGGGSSLVSALAVAASVAVPTSRQSQSRDSGSRNGENRGDGGGGATVGILRVGDGDGSGGGGDDHDAPSFDALDAKVRNDMGKTVDMKQFAAGFAGMGLESIVKRDLGELATSLPVTPETERRGSNNALEVPINFNDNDNDNGNAYVVPSSTLAFLGSTGKPGSPSRVMHGSALRRKSSFTSMGSAGISFPDDNIGGGGTGGGGRPQSKVSFRLPLSLQKEEVEEGYRQKNNISQQSQDLRGFSRESGSPGSPGGSSTGGGGAGGRGSGGGGGLFVSSPSSANSASPMRDSGMRVMMGSSDSGGIDSGSPALYINDDESNPFPSPSRGIVNSQLLHYSRGGTGMSRGSLGSEVLESREGRDGEGGGGEGGGRRGGGEGGGRRRGGGEGGGGGGEGKGSSMPIVPWDDD